ncbi:MAG: tRNA (adenosine(37)-N6)-threonylcarbamoyltransferase complex ATPase subunit type 1 TsaE [Patescibacteria group bacterium]|nr:tRNA (adenosine(37)-N6)-threonylcarbamoyltransferase complex ATPase subunit type 1 TsaE [Patescibacteria group bacterium]MDE1966425.1 tRNA (adenosine(37)-N6)-threonylcarbamoyltransferase complex ATPase subunit type 1 TsaE [Patescibacteria group bacterium]
MDGNLRTLEELAAHAGSFVKGLVPAGKGATLVTLSGELGAGKTAFVKAAARALGIAEDVTSPTFVLEKIYALPVQSPATFPEKSGGGFARLVHIDAYRLASGAELAALGFDEIMQDAGNLVMLEWPERVADSLPIPAARVKLAAHADGSRTISYG